MRLRADTDRVGSSSDGGGGAAHPDKPVLTDDGAAWGMKLADRDVASRPASVTDVTTVLTRVGKYYASCWFRNFDASRPSSGFVRYRTNLRANDDADIEDYLRVALHGLE